MNEGLKFTANAGEGDGFTIKTWHGCRVVFGPVPMSAVGMLMHGYSKKALMAIDIASRVGATFVIGEPDALEALRQWKDLPISEARLQDYQKACLSGWPSIAEWLRNGDRGASSEAMCKALIGFPLSAEVDHPHDPEDLQRCLTFMRHAEADGAKTCIALMRNLSPEWTRLAAIWDALVKTFEQERQFGHAPRTYALMQTALEQDGALSFSESV